MPRSTRLLRSTVALFAIASVGIACSAADSTASSDPATASTGTANPLVGFEHGREHLPFGSASSAATATAPTSTATAPAPTSTATATAPAPTSTTAPAPTSTTAPAPTSTTAPAPTSTTAPAPTSTTAPAPTGTLKSLYVTFYGWPDNSPPGPGIAYPGLHSQAGGTGSYADPITFATDASEFAPGTILYVPFIEKYVIMEDGCTECSADWSRGKWHIDIWMNSNGSYGSQVLACEDNWTQSTAQVEIDPPSNRPVTLPPLFDTSTGVCRTSP